MDLDLLNASLGYKLSGDPVRTPPYCLTNDEELREAIKKGIEKTRRARTREVFVEIHHLVCATGISWKLKLNIPATTTIFSKVLSSEHWP